MRRPERFAEQIREEIMEIVGYELKDPRLIAVTVTDVRVSDDKRDAKVFVTVEGSENEIREAMKALRNAENFVRGQLVLSMDLRHVPHVHFVRDTIEEKAGRIDKILEGLKVTDDEIVIDE